MKTIAPEKQSLFIKDFAMNEKITQTDPNKKSISDILKDSMMVILTLIFVLLYAAAFTGKLDPLKDNTMLIRLEPIIFVLIGYYFGLFPSKRNEKSLKEEITRQTQKADAAQFAKEKAQQERETLEERIKNAKTALKAINMSEKKTDEQSKTETLKTVLRILDS